MRKLQFCRLEILWPRQHTVGVSSVDDSFGEICLILQLSKLYKVLNYIYCFKMFVSIESILSIAKNMSRELNLDFYANSVYNNMYLSRQYTKIFYPGALGRNA